jgi:hypothetical protein
MIFLIWYNERKSADICVILLQNSKNNNNIKNIFQISVGFSHYFFLFNESKKEKESIILKIINKILVLMF